MKTYLVLGVGFIGKHLVLDLLKKGYEVLAVNQSIVDIEHKNFTFFQADIRHDPLPLYDVDGIYLLAGSIGAKGIKFDPYQMLSDNILIMQNVIKHYGRSGKKIVFVSSDEVNYIEDLFDKRWAYAYSKEVCEILLAHSGAEYSIAQLSNVYGPQMQGNYVVKSFIQSFLSEPKQRRVATPNDTRSFIYVDDVVQGLELLMKSDKTDGEVVVIAHPRTTKILQLARLIRKLTGAKTKIKKDDTIEAELRDPDTKEAKLLLNFKAKTSLQDGLKKTIDWYKKELNA